MAFKNLNSQLIKETSNLMKQVYKSIFPAKVVQGRRRRRLFRDAVDDALHHFTEVAGISAQRRQC